MSELEMKTYDALVAENPELVRILTPGMADGMFASSSATVSSLSPEWKTNALKNFKYYKKHGSFINAFHRFGINKAVIGVGAGPSFHKNKDLLKRIYQWNLQFSLSEQPFVIVATNKMFKPLLQLGIHPHFVFLIDAGDVLYEQLCVDIPEEAKKSILVTGLQVSNKIIKGWDKNGGHICFYGLSDVESPELVKKIGKRELDRICLHQGGNVLNTLWAAAGKVLGSYVFMAIANDLCMKYSNSYEERAKGFYSVGDYRMSILNKRDDAKDNFAWMGVSNLKENQFMPGNMVYDLELVSTSRQLWIYKTWIEVQATVWAKQKSFQYFNCTEGGICGVNARVNNGSMMGEKSNWFLMDEVIPGRWFTRPLKTAVDMFLEARELCRMRTGVILTDVRNAGILPGQIIGVNSIGQARSITDFR